MRPEKVDILNMQKKGLKLSYKSLKYMVSPVGLEPTTCRL